MLIHRGAREAQNRSKLDEVQVGSHRYLIGNAADSPTAVQPFVRLAHFALDSARSPMTSRLCNVNVYVPTPRACHHVAQPRTLAL